MSCIFNFLILHKGCLKVIYGVVFWAIGGGNLKETDLLKGLVETLKIHLMIVPFFYELKINLKNCNRMNCHKSSWVMYSL